MAYRLVHYRQDEQKWIDHYMAQAMKQVKPKSMTKPLKDKVVHPNYVLPTMQLVAQAKSEMKQRQKETPVFAPIKATPEFDVKHTSQVTAEEKSASKKRKATHPTTTSTTKKRKKTTESPKKQISKKKKKSKKTADTVRQEEEEGDIFQ